MVRYALGNNRASGTSREELKPSSSAISRVACALSFALLLAVSTYAQQPDQQSQQPDPNAQQQGQPGDSGQAQAPPPAASAPQDQPPAPSQNGPPNRTPIRRHRLRRRSQSMHRKMRTGHRTRMTIPHPKPEHRRMRRARINMIRTRICRQESRARRRSQCAERCSRHEQCAFEPAL